MTEAATEGASPRHQASLHSLMDSPHHTELDPVFRYVSDLPSLITPHYMELDARTAWRPVQRLELALACEKPAA